MWVFFLLHASSSSLRQGQEAPWWTTASPQHGCSPVFSVGLSWWPRWEGFSPLFPTGSVFYDASQYRQPLSPPRAMAVSVSWRTMDDGVQKGTTLHGGRNNNNNNKTTFSYKNQQQVWPFIGSLWEESTYCARPSLQASWEEGGRQHACLLHHRGNQEPSPWRSDEEERDRCTLWVQGTR